LTSYYALCDSLVSHIPHSPTHCTRFPERVTVAMKFLSAGLLALTAPLASAAAFSLFDPSQVSLKTDDPKFPVEGDNPLSYCADPASYRLEIESVDLTPNPPLAYVDPTNTLVLWRILLTDILLLIEVRS
jgi:hypothetical protein